MQALIVSVNFKYNTHCFCILDILLRFETNIKIADSFGCDYSVRKCDKIINDYIQSILFSISDFNTYKFPFRLWLD